MNQNMFLGYFWGFQVFARDTTARKSPILGAHLSYAAFDGQKMEENQCIANDSLDQKNSFFWLFLTSSWRFLPNIESMWHDFPL